MRGVGRPLVIALACRRRFIFGGWWGKGGGGGRREGWGGK